MAEQLKNFIDKIGANWAALEPKRKKIILAASGGIIVFAVIVTLVLNMNANNYKTMFPGMSDEETSEVYATLLDMGVRPQIDDKGNIKVPAAEWDDLQYRLSAAGYPKSALTYGTFTNMSGFTTTEFEKRVALTYQLQDRLQSTMRRWNGISDATVTISIPEHSNFVWDQTAATKSSASVTVLTERGLELRPEQVSAIKNHVASSVPKLAPEDVSVIDATTGLQPKTLEELMKEDKYSGNEKRLEFEREIETRLEQNVLRLLTPTYGPGGVTAVAKVVIDYDSMLTERRELLPGEDGKGLITHRDESYTVNGNQPELGIVGEEYNTDVPVYPSFDELDPGQTTDFDRSTDYDVGYVLTQIEKGEPILKEATIAVIVNDPNFTEEKEDILLMLVSRSVNIDPEFIRVSNLDFTREVPVSTIPAGSDFVWDMQTVLLVGGIGLLVIMLIITAVVIGMRRKARRELEEEERRLQEEADRIEREELEKRRNIERGIEDHKRMLQDEAKSASNQIETAITEEVREFAVQNPELTASLIRSLMKEDR